MHKKISFTVNTERNANVGDTFLTYSTNTMNELTLEGSPEGLALLAERLLAAAREGKAAAISFEDNPPVSPAYMKQKEEEAAEFVEKLPSMEVGKSYILTFMKDGKVRNNSNHRLISIDRQNHHNRSEDSKEKCFTLTSGTESHLAPPP